MKVKGTFVGTVEGEARVVTPQGKTPFLTYKLTSPEGEYTTNLDCKEYSKDVNVLNTEAANIREGMTILVTGSVSARGFAGKKDPSKVYGALEMFVREKQILFHPQGQAQTSDPFEQSRPKQPTPRTAQGQRSSPAATSGSIDDVY